MPTHRPPDELTQEERFREIARILARGVRQYRQRLRDKRKTLESARKRVGQ